MVGCVASGGEGEAYAGVGEEVLDALALGGGQVDRWAERPVTRFERKGLDVGRAITDLAYTRV